MAFCNYPSSLAAASILLAACTPPEGSNVDAANTPDLVVDEFLTALDNLDLDGIMGTLSDDATMFFPHSYATFRADGKDRIEREMKTAFRVGRAAALEAGRTEPPYLGVVDNVSDRKLQTLGARGAIVTWMVDRPGNFGRRSAALRLDTDGAWKVVNFHSSNLRSSDPNEN